MTRLILLATLLAGCAFTPASDPDDDLDQPGDWCKHVCEPGTVQAFSTWGTCSCFEKIQPLIFERTAP